MQFSLFFPQFRKQKGQIYTTKKVLNYFSNDFQLLKNKDTKLGTYSIYLFLKRNIKLLEKNSNFIEKFVLLL